MIMNIIILFYASIILLFKVVLGGEKTAGIFKIPELIINSNNNYLTRNVETRLECSISGQPVEWMGATLQHVLWLRDGAPIDVANLNEGSNANFILESSSNSQTTGTILRVSQTGHHSEGEYQCSAIVRHIAVSPLRKIDTRLVSAPLKLRRARITKFERYEPPVIRVRQGQVARLPCYGLPDVIPGPPDLWFEKLGHEGLALGKTGNERFIVTASGLQIALSQPADAGRYFCVIRNTFTNQTRKSPRPIHLVVEAQEYSNINSKPPIFGSVARMAVPIVIFPETVNRSEPIEFHVVVGQNIILECVIWDAKIIWNRTDFPMESISLTDERARIRQIWGNLRIKQVRLEDAGEYICRGIPAIDLTASREENNFKIRHSFVVYRLLVHAPTNVRLILAQSLNDKSWQLSCYAHNLHYEIPMVYVNGLALIDAVEEMGIPPQTNFFTNPINITLNSGSPLAGSVQCISRPAMEEAEVYGNGLERGRAMNLYVDESLNKLPFLHTSSTKTERSHRLHISSNENMHNERDEDKKKVNLAQNSFQIHQPLAFIAGDNSIRIQWRIDFRDEEKKTRIQNFLIEILQRKNKSFQHEDIEYNDGDYENEDSNDKNDYNDIRKMSRNSEQWHVFERVPPHVRALTLRRAVAPFGTEFQLRVTAVLENLKHISSQPTDWLKITELNHSKTAINLPPSQFTYIILQPMSPHSILITWNYTDVITPDKFIITYEPFETKYLKKSAERRVKLSSDKLNEASTVENKRNIAVNDNNDERSIEGWNSWLQKTIEVDAQKHHTNYLLTNLNSDTEYKVIIKAINSVGRSITSEPQISRTYVLLEDTSDDVNWVTKLRRNYLNLPELNIKFELMIIAFIVAVLLLIVICYLTVLRLREWRLYALTRNRNDRMRQTSSSGSANQFFIESSSPVIFPSPDGISCFQSRKTESVTYEPKFFIAQNSIAEPQVGYGNVQRRDEKGFMLQVNLHDENVVKSSLIVKNNNDTCNSADIYKTDDNNNSCLSSSNEKTNLDTNNSNTETGTLADELIYGPLHFTTANPIFSRNATINRSGTLKRVAGSQQSGSTARSPLITNNRQPDNTIMSTSTTLLARPSSELRFENERIEPKSPSLLSTSICGNGSTALPYDFIRKSSQQPSHMHDGVCSDTDILTNNNMNNDVYENRLQYYRNINENLTSINGIPMHIKIGEPFHTYSRLSLSNLDFGMYNDESITPTTDIQMPKLSTFTSMATSANPTMLSTFKISPAPSSCGGSSTSGYNSYGSNGCTLTLNGHCNTTLNGSENKSMQSPVKILSSTSINNSFVRRKRYPTIAVAPMFFDRNLVDNSENYNKDEQTSKVQTESLNSTLSIYQSKKVPSITEDMSINQLY